MSPLKDYSTDKGPIAWMAQNPVAANLLMLMLIIGGVASTFTIKQEVFPDFELDMVNITVPYPGASPEEVEQGILLAVEEAVRGIDGVKRVTSKASEGAGTVSVELLITADNQRTYQDIKQEVDRITTLPEESERPNVVLVSRKRQVVTSVVYGDVPPTTLRQVAEMLRDRLLQDPDITQVGLSAIKPLEISISIPRETLRMYNLTLRQVADLIGKSALELPGGSVKTEGGEILLRVDDRKDYGREFADIPIISAANGTQVRLGDMAEIRDDFEEVDRFSTFNGQPAIMLDVYRIGKQTPIRVSNATARKIEALQSELPPGVQYAVMRDRSEHFRQRMELLGRNGAIGLTLVLLLLGFFLEIRLAFWVAMGIPISFMGAIFLMPMFGLSINMVSMFAFLIALGIVVDDAIVVGENIYEYHQRGYPFIQAAITGTREVAVPVTFSVLTNVITFVPIFFVPGIMGKIFKVIPAVVIVVFLISLFESLYILPAHLAHNKDKRRTRFGERLHKRQQRFSHAFSAFIQNRYGPFLEKVLHHRYITFAVAVAILTITISYVASGRMGMVPMPRVDADYSMITAILPYGSPVETSIEVRDKLIAAIEAVNAEYDGKAVESMYAEIGNSFNGVSGSHVVEVRANLPPPDKRLVKTREFTEMIRKKAGRIPGLVTLQFSSDSGGPGRGASLTIELSHADHAILEQAAIELADEISLFPNAKDIDSGVASGKPQLNFSVRPEGINLGLTASEIARQVRAAFYGAEALRQQRGRNEVKVKVRLPREERISEHDIDEFLVRTPAGTDVPLCEVADLVRGRAYTSIDRREARRVISVTADIVPQQHTEQVRATVEAEILPRLLEKYHGLNYSYEGKQADMAESLGVLKIGFLLAMFGIYGMLAIPFKSYIQPAIIMVSIPFGIVGAIIGHIIMGYNLSIISMMGIVALSGVVVNDSLVFIDFANREYQAGASAHDAVCLAGVRRFRPIMLTTLTTFCGLAPMIFEQSRQARFMIPMAISLGYGILFATLITLVLIPSLYMIVEDIRTRFGFHQPPHNAS
ncbi:MAG: efflux RND transporter permease subunit [Spartobacteria bacterium]|nr:efflux RND transporter permease subunit [Spartobacteria bacterium]